MKVSPRAIPGEYINDAINLKPSSAETPLRSKKSR